MKRRLPLRMRAMIAFGGMAAVVATLVALACYQVTRTTLIDQRERVAERQAYVNARAVGNALTSDPDNPATALSSAQTSAQGFALLREDDEWFSSSVTGSRDQVPGDMIEVMESGTAARQRLQTAIGASVAVGVPIAGTGAPALYVEFVPMAEVSQSLNGVRQGLLVAAFGATALGVAAGWWASGRILQPVRQTADAANLISEGALDRRLESDGDADLEPLVDSFNEMVDGLQSRIEREARFASDVSHELRTPLAAMLAALSVARRRVSEPAGVEALDHLQREVDGFTALITDLLEISRVEAGVAELVLERVDAEEFLAAAVESAGGDEVPVTMGPGAPHQFHFDKRRMSQVLVNLLQNAANYAGGATGLRVEGDRESVRFVVDDAGPGIPPDEREHVFERFARGADPTVPGTGLGLALVAEHLRLHRGSVAIEDSPAGGARFVVTIPKDQS
ncbi:MAG: HAMP domain-containing histidine kinase [Acidimicrobiales bacterium]|nr:HAMP domain-containing histidine kinase [Acidimicrobiales bacterium]